jgi:hypothetical protein
MKPEQQRRQQNGAEWVNVTQGVKRHAPQSRGGVIAKNMRDTTMGRLMQCDREQQGQDPGRRGIDHHAKWRSIILSACSQPQFRRGSDTKGHSD